MTKTDLDMMEAMIGKLQEKNKTENNFFTLKTNFTI